MLYYYSLIDIGLTIDEFLKKALAFNIAKLEKHPKLHSGFNSFYSYLKGISDFGRMVFWEKKDLKLYAEKIGQTDYLNQKTKFHAIDSTGLVYGHIIGPSLEIISPVADVALSDKLLYPKTDEFYGLGNAEKGGDFDCVIKMNANTYEESIPVNLELLRLSYLPLRKGYELKDNRYFTSSNKSNVYYYSSVIYKADDRSFYLPFYELLRSNPNLSKNTLTIKPRLKKEHISFEAEIYSRDLKHEYTKTWAGIISYDKFEIVSLELSNETKEYIG